MPHEPGEPALSGDISVSRPGAAAVAAGDAVALAGGEMVQATGTDDFGGIARHDANNGGYGNSNILSGVVLANVAAGTAEGARLNTSATAGELAAEANGPVLALSAEGGTWHGEEQTYTAPAGYAYVHY